VKRLLMLVTLLACVTSSAFARQKIDGYCERGGRTVTVSGITSTNKVQESWPSCTVNVYQTATLTPLSIYSDNAGTVKANPFTADTNGYWFFYVDNGRVDVAMSGGGIPSPFTRSDFIADDNAELTLPLNAMTFSATPTFDASQFSTFTMTLTANVTSSTVTNAKTGRMIAFLLCQDGVGGRTFAWPANFTSAPTLRSSASKCTNLIWIYDGTNWKLIASGGDSLTVATSGVIMNGSAVLILPTASDNIMGRATVDTMLNKTMSGGALTGAISGAGLTFTGGTFSTITFSGTITNGGTITGGNISTPTIANPTVTGTINGTPTFSGAITMSSTLSVAGQVTLSVPTGTQPLNVTSITPVDNLTIKRWNSFIAINTANAVTFTTANPAAPRVVTLPDFGADGFVLQTRTANTVDCDTADTTCNFNGYVNVNLGQCLTPTTGSTNVSIVSADPAVPTCVNGANVGYFTLWMPGSFTQVQTATGNNGAGAGTVTATYSTSAGRLLVTAVATDGNQTVSGCTDGTNVYALAIRQNNLGNDTIETWYKANATAVNGVTLTCTLSGAVKAALTWADFNGALTVAPLDVTVGNTGNDTSPTSGNTAAAALAPDLVIAAVAAKNTPVVTSPSSGFIQNPTSTATASPTVAMQTKVPPSTSGQSSTFTLGSVQQWASTTAIFKPATAGVTYSRFTVPVRVPDDFSGGTLDVKIGFRTALASLSNAQITLGVATTCVSDGAALDQALNTESTQVNNALAGVNGGANTTTITSIDITGCTAGKHMFLSVFRKRGISGDQTALPAELTTLQYKLRHSQ
jgi:hypothetical protein